MAKSKCALWTWLFYLGLSSQTAAAVQPWTPLVSSSELSGLGARVRGLLHVSKDTAIDKALAAEWKGTLYQAGDAACLEDFMASGLMSFSRRIHSDGTPILDHVEELSSSVGGLLRTCWRMQERDSCVFFVALVDLVALSKLAPGTPSRSWGVTGSATVAVLAPPHCSPEQVAVELVPAVVQRPSEVAADENGFAVTGVQVKEVRPGDFEQKRLHWNLSRWLPDNPDGVNYPEEAVAGFDAHCYQGAVGPTSNTSQGLFHRFFGRVLCSPTIWSRPEDFGSLKIYVERLPPMLTEDRIVTAHLLHLAHNYSCDPFSFLCSEAAWDGAWSSWRQYTGQAVLLQKFLTAPQGVLVDDPNQADIILVPLLSQFISSWFVFKQESKGCPRETMKILKYMEYPKRPSPHVFIFADHMMNVLHHDIGGLQSLFAMENDSVFISHGANGCSPRHVTMPTVLTDRVLQPSNLAKELWRDRDIFIVYAETPDCCHPVRRALYDVLRSEVGQFLCGPSCVVLQRSRVGVHSEDTASHGLLNASNDDFNDVMLRATFCPMGPGDAPFRHKFYHAFLAGCIPVLFEFNSYWKGQRSWWKEYGSPWELSVPFPEDIPYEEIVVRIPCEANYTAAALNLLKKLRSMPPTEVQHRQKLIKESRHLLGFNWDGSKPDAFTAIMQRIINIVKGEPQIR